MLIILGFVLLVITVAHPAITQEPNSDSGNELFKNRLDQLELRLQNTTNVLLQKIINSLNDIKQHSSQTPIIESCQEASFSGRYLLQLPMRSAPVTVLCEANLSGGGWLVIQRRFDGSVDFNRSWAEYRDGFGVVGPSSEFWLGLETIHQLTKTGDHELLVQLKNEFGHFGYARYDRFQVDGEDQKFTLLPVGEYSGTIGENFNISRNEEFSTCDRDNDSSDENCAQTFAGGWWFFGCTHATLNGPFERDNNTDQGIYWSGWTDAASYSRILIRRK